MIKINSVNLLFNSNSWGEQSEDVHHTFAGVRTGLIFGFVRRVSSLYAYILWPQGKVWKNKQKKKRDRGPSDESRVFRPKNSYRGWEGGHIKNIFFSSRLFFHFPFACMYFFLLIIIQYDIIMYVYLRCGRTLPRRLHYRPCLPAKDVSSASSSSSTLHKFTITHTHTHIYTYMHAI